MCQEHKRNSRNARGGLKAQVRGIPGALRVVVLELSLQRNSRRRRWGSLGHGSAERALPGELGSGRPERECGRVSAPGPGGGAWKGRVLGLCGCLKRSTPKTLPQACVCTGVHIIHK